MPTCAVAGARVVMPIANQQKGGEAVQLQKRIKLPDSIIPSIARINASEQKKDRGTGSCWSANGDRRPIRTVSLGCFRQDVSLGMW